MAVAKDNIVSVTLAGQDFLMKRVPMARIKRLSKVIASVMFDRTKVDNESTPDEVQSFIDDSIEKLVSEFPYEIMSVFIDKLPREIFDDEVSGVTFPELYDALLAAVELNRLDALKKAFLAAVPLMQAVSK